MRWNVQFVAGLLLAWRGWTLAEGWIDRDLIENEFQVGTFVVLGALIILIWIVPGVGLLPALAFFAAGLFGLGLARRAERRAPNAIVESDWLVLVGGMVLLVIAVAVAVVALVTPDVLLAMFEQVQLVLSAILAGIGAFFQWVGSFFPGAGEPGPQPTMGPLNGPIVPQQPIVDRPSGMEDFRFLEIVIVFVLVVFLFFAVKAIIRLIKTTDFRQLTLALPRRRDPAPPVSSADAFTWGGWWKLVLTWFRGWLGSTRTSTSGAERRREANAAAAAEQRSIRALYRELLTALARAGFERQPSTTPNELAREVTTARPAAANAVSTVTDLYVRTRYGEEELGRSELTRMRNAVQQARKDLTPPPPRDR
jgi:hypothetical protein